VPAIRLEPGRESSKVTNVGIQHSDTVAMPEKMIV
jgi:hypothetical protein